MTRMDSGRENAPGSGHYRWGLSALLLALVIIGLIVWRVLLVRTTTVTASLHVASVPRSIIGEPTQGGVDVATYRKTAVALMKGPFVLNHALSSPQVAQVGIVRRIASRDIDIVDWLARNLEVSFRDGSDVLEVSLTGDDPEELAVLVNSVVDSYMHLVAKEERDARLARLEKLKELWGRYQRELKIKRRSIDDLEATVNAGETAVAASGLDREEAREQRALVRHELLRAQQATAAARARLDRRRKDESNERERERLADEIASREAEARFLSAELERLQLKPSPQLKSIDLAPERLEIAIAEEMARQTGLAVEHAQLELDAPDRVRVLSVAKPSRAVARRRSLLAGW